MSDVQTVGAEYDQWKRRTAFTALVLLTTAVVVARIPPFNFPLHQLQSQDVLPLACLGVSLLVVAFFTPAWRLPTRLPHPAWLMAAGVVLVGVLAFGSYALMGNFQLSVDERMVIFDMAVFDGRSLATPLAADWRPYAMALVPAALLNDNMPIGLVSAYLPMNAVLRLAFAKLANPALFNPFLALVGGAALFHIARRLFGKDDPSCWVVLLVYALSAQMLLNAMTVYSMTGHMTLNLIWLAAFLRGGRLGHATAIAAGFLATGLHQVAFHPFFVAPFLLWRLRGGQRKLVVLYAAAYSAIVIFWICYPILAGREAIDVLQPTPQGSFLERISAAFDQRRHERISTMIFNLLRFIAWQNLALLPLLSAAVAVAVRDRGLPAALFMGMTLWVVFLTIVIPFQGHGWGFRYLHPYLGSFALLAGYGYRELKEVVGRKIDGLVLTLSGVTALVTIPLSLVAATKFVQPYIALERLVAMQETPFVLIDDFPRPTKQGPWAGSAIEVVRNLPDLSNRPLRFSARNMTPELLTELCDRDRIALIGAPEQHRIGFGLNVSSDSPSFAKLVDKGSQKHNGCFVSAQGQDR